MKELDTRVRLMLACPLPQEALKPHPTKFTYIDGQRIPMTAINPIYVSERLNMVFGVGGWSFCTSNEVTEAFVQNTKKGERNMFKGIVKCRLELSNGAYYETTASSDNDDAGDALKGAATDGLTKLASWIGVGAHVWKNLDHSTAMDLWQKEWADFTKSKSQNKAISAIQGMIEVGSDPQKQMLAKVLSSSVFSDEYCLDNGLKDRAYYLFALNSASSKEAYQEIANEILTEVSQRKKAQKQSK